MEVKERAINVPKPPHAPVRPVIDNVHGIVIEDPYRWLEDGESQETLEWTEAQNHRTRYVLDQLEERPRLAARLTEILSQETVGSPVLKGNALFYTRREKGANQPLLCCRTLSHGSLGDERVVLDPNETSASGLVALDWWYPSDDGNLLAYGYSEKGDEWSILRVLDIAAGKVLPDTIERCRNAGVVWEKDGRGFYYTRYPKPGQVPPGDEFYYRKVYHHTLGTDPSADTLVYGEGRPKDEMYGVSLSDSGKYLLLTVTHGWNSTDLYFRDETKPGSPFVPVIVGVDALFHGRIMGDTLYIHTNWNASRYKVMAVDLTQPKLGKWKEIIPEAPDFTLESVTFAGGKIVVSGLKDAVSHLYCYDIDGSGKREINLPALGAITGVAGQMTGTDLLFVFESFALAPSIYHLNLQSQGDPEVLLASKQSVDPSSILVKQVIYPSKDGTRIPMFVLHKASVPAGEPGSQPVPTLLTGYGGFNLPRTPNYSPTAIPWLENGGIYAVANLRGGSEYGEAWHRAGMRENKQNVFDDYAAAGEYLVAQGYTDVEHLGAFGRSNGGLLMGATITQRPDLFKALVCGVPLLDMVRYHKFLIAYIWASEYGDPDNPDEFKWLYAYSPYHRVNPKTVYPAMYTFTATSDSRVDPCHARKMTARLQAAQEVSASTNPILLNVEADAGHGVGKPLYKVVGEQADMWAFLAWQLGLRIS